MASHSVSFPISKESDAIPRRQCEFEVEDPAMTSGTVKFYNDVKGYGFIEPEDGGKDVFVHATALERNGLKALAEGQKVQFETDVDPRSGKPAVTKIEAL